MNWEKSRQTFRAVLNLWKERGTLGSSRIANDLKNFLPPALEVMEKPPHPAPRVILVVIAIICIFGLIWSILGKVDVITVTDGKIIPSGKVKQIQPFSRGVVSAILVSEGQLVDAGQPLVELDQVQTMADEIRLTVEGKFAEEKKMRRTIMVDLLRRSTDRLTDDDEIRRHPVLNGDLKNGNLLLEEYKSVISQWQTLESQLEERRAEWATSQEIIKQYTATLPLIEQRLASYQTLYDRKLVTINEFLAMEEERLRQYHTLESEKARSEQLTAAIHSTEKQLDGLKAQSLSEALNELDDLNRQLEAIAQELAKARDLGAKQVMYAPVRGTIKGLAIATVGGVVEPAQVLMELVPFGETLEVEAFISNQDIGYVQPGQTAEVKVQTFPFTKYGIIDAKVEVVADDATVDEKRGLIYRTRLSLAQSTIKVDGRDVPLMPGMAINAEIATDQKRLIEFFLAPLLRMKDESLRER